MHNIVILSGGLLALSTIATAEYRAYPSQYSHYGLVVDTNLI